MTEEADSALVLAAKLGSLEKSVDDFKTETKQSFNQLNSKLDYKLDDHDKRIKALENWRSALGGALAVLVFAVGYLATFIINNYK